MRSTHHNSAPPLAALALCVLATTATAAMLAPDAPRQQRPQQSAAAEPPVADLARGVELYKAAKYREAIEVLRGVVKKRKQDAQAWLHLGIAQNRAGDEKEARKAFEKAIKLRPEMPEPHIGMAFIFFAAGKTREAEAAAARAVALDPRNAESHYAVSLLRARQGSPLKALEEVNEALRLNPNFGPALILKAHVLLEAYAAEPASAEAQPTAAADQFPMVADRPPGVADQPQAVLSPAQRAKMADWLQEAATSLDAYLRLFPASPDASRLGAQAKAFRAQADALLTSDEPLVYKAGEVTTKAQITAKPEPLYTEKARQKGVTGTVRLRMLLSFDGEVRNIQVVRGLSHGLTESAVAAARRIKFTPAMNGVRPVSQFVTIEYNFNIY